MVFLSEVDNGGPCTYDPSVTSTTTTVWEPFLNLSKDGKLVCYYSDERQKENGVLQAVSFKTSSDGKNWSSLSNVAAITNKKDRPGMITVSSLPMVNILQHMKLLIDQVLVRIML